MCERVRSKKASEHGAKYRRVESSARRLAGGHSTKPNHPSPADRFFELSYEEGTNPAQWKPSDEEASAINEAFKAWSSYSFYDESDGGLLGAAASTADPTELSPPKCYRSRSRKRSRSRYSPLTASSSGSTSQSMEEPAVLTQEEQTEYIRSFLAANGMNNAINLRWCAKLELKAKVSSNVAATR